MLGIFLVPSPSKVIQASSPNPSTEVRVFAVRGPSILADVARIRAAGADLRSGQRSSDGIPGRGWPVRERLRPHEVRWDHPEEALEFAAGDLDRSVVVRDQIRTVVRG